MGHYSGGDAMQQVRMQGRQHGSAAVELALIIPVLVLFLSFPAFIAKCLWHYTIVQKAAQDSVRYFATIPKQSMREPGLVSGEVALTKRIARIETADLRPGHAAPTIEVYCDTELCTTTTGGIIPDRVRVVVKASMFDDILGTVPTGRYGIPITAEAIMPYAGRGL
jgi:hypothetical protein